MDNVISLTTSSYRKAQDIIEYSVASKLNISKEDVLDYQLRIASETTQHVRNGYIITDIGYGIEVFIVVQTEIAGYYYPLLFRDNSSMELVGIYTSDMELIWNGSFSEFVSSSSYMSLYHKFLDTIPYIISGAKMIALAYVAK